MFRHEYPNRDRKDHRLRLLPERLGGVLFAFVIKKIGYFMIIVIHWYHFFSNVYMISDACFALQLNENSFRLTIMSCN